MRTIQRTLFSILLITTLISGAYGAQYVEIVLKNRECDTVYKAVGTVRPRVEAKVMAQASGRILTIAVAEGDRIEKGDELATVESAQLDLRLSQARSGVEAAEAQKMQAEFGKIGALAMLAQASAEYNRVKKLHAQQAATPQQLEQVEAAFKQAKASVAGANEAINAASAAVKRANSAVAEVKVALGYTKVTADHSCT